MSGIEKMYECCGNCIHSIKMRDENKQEYALCKLDDLYPVEKLRSSICDYYHNQDRYEDFI